MTLHMELMSSQGMAVRPFCAARVPRHCRSASVCRASFGRPDREETPGSQDACDGQQVHRRAMLASMGAAAVLSCVSASAQADVQVCKLARSAALQLFVPLTEAIAALEPSQLKCYGYTLRRNTSSNEHAAQLLSGRLHGMFHWSGHQKAEINTFRADAKMVQLIGNPIRLYRTM